jgi:tRNA(Ile2)-agmatinylcytidine synthase
VPPRQVCLLLAFDNTDGPDGGCTTHLAFHVLLALPELALTGMPRLVRLNPNVPWKTRGNGAVVLPLGKPTGPQVRVGELRGHEILAFPDGQPVAASEDILQRAWAVLEKQSQPGAMPAVALLDDQPPESTYWAAVRTFVHPDEAKAAAADLAVHRRATGDGRGLIGCLAAAAWAGPPSSFEFIAYREPAKFGKERKVDPRPLMGLDLTGATFHTYDPEAVRLCCVPHTPDPVLIALRGRDADRLRDTCLRVLPTALSEPVDGWLLWASNQASGDHVTPLESIAEMPEMGTGSLVATVAAPPSTRPGGHVVLAVQDAAGTAFEAIAFEPTKSFRNHVRGLVAGDQVRLVGALTDGALRLEKMEVIRLARRERIVNPICQCGKSMRSKGPSTGYKCPACGSFKPRNAATAVPEKPQAEVGWHEVPIIARRHLHRPTSWENPVVKRSLGSGHNH